MKNKLKIVKNNKLKIFNFIPCGFFLLFCMAFFKTRLKHLMPKRQLIKMLGLSILFLIPISIVVNLVELVERLRELLYAYPVAFVISLLAVITVVSIPFNIHMLKLYKDYMDNFDKYNHN